MEAAAQTGQSVSGVIGNIQQFSNMYSQTDNPHTSKVKSLLFLLYLHHGLNILKRKIFNSWSKLLLISYIWHLCRYTDFY